MGIYTDIQADVKEAMEDDLLDTVAVLTISESTGAVYNPATGGITDTPTVSVMDCILGDDKTGEDVEEETSTDFITVIILDSDKTTSFKTGQNANVRGSDYEVTGYEVDPAGATHILKCRRR